MSSTQGGIISLNFGGCGVRLGASTTRLYAEDFGIGMDGSIASNRMREGYYYDVFFSEQKGSSDQDNKKFLSRSLYFDSDPDSLDSITGMAGLIPELCKPVWADGLVLEPAYTYTKGQEYFDKSKDYFEQSVRVLAEQTDKLQGFIGTASASGGFSSGYSVRALTLLKDTFGVKKSFIGNTLLPDLSLGLEAAEATNTLLLTSAVRSGLYDAQYVFQNIPAQRLLSKYQIQGFASWNDINSLMADFLWMLYSSFAKEDRPVESLHYLVRHMVPTTSLNSIEMYSGRLYPRHHPQLNLAICSAEAPGEIAENGLIQRTQEEIKLLGGISIHLSENQPKVHRGSAISTEAHSGLESFSWAGPLRTTYLTPRATLLPPLFLARTLLACNTWNFRWFLRSLSRCFAPDADTSQFGESSSQTTVLEAVDLPKDELAEILNDFSCGFEDYESLDC